MFGWCRWLCVCIECGEIDEVLVNVMCEVFVKSEDSMIDVFVLYLWKFVENLDDVDCVFEDLGKGYLMCCAKVFED